MAHSFLSSGYMIIFILTCYGTPLLAQREHVSGDGIKFELKDATYTNTNDGAILPDITTGFRPFVYTWTGPDGFVSMDSILYHLTAGTYVVHIEDALCGKFTDTIRLKSLNDQALIETINLISASPNPFADKIELQIQSQMASTITVVFYSSYGISYLHQQNVQLNPGENKITLDTTTFPPGSYVGNIITSDNVKLTIQLVKS